MSPVVGGGEAIVLWAAVWKGSWGESSCGVDLRPWRGLVLELGARLPSLGVEVHRQCRGVVRNSYKYMENNDESK